jgi:Iron-sulfur cluster-binding domain
MKGLAALRQTGVQWNALTTVHAASQDRGREVYRFLRDECGARFMQFIPIIERATPQTLPMANAGWGKNVRDRPLYTQDGALVTQRSVTPGGYGRFLIDVFEDWVRRDVGEVYIQMFDVALANWYGEPPGLCVHSETCGLALALEHTGDLYSCDHFVEPGYKLGNIRHKTMIELVNSSRQVEFGLAKRDTLPDSAAGATSVSPATADAPRTGSPARPTVRRACTTCAPATRRSSAISGPRWKPCASCCGQASHPHGSPNATPRRTLSEAATSHALAAQAANGNAAMAQR